MNHTHAHPQFNYKTLNPEWNDEEIPPLRLLSNRPARLRGEFISVRLYDHDFLSPDDYLGE